MINGRKWTRKGLSVHCCSGQRQNLSALVKLKFAPAWTGFLLSIQMWTYDKSFARWVRFDGSVLFLFCVGQGDDFVAAIDDNLFHGFVAGGAVGGDVGGFIFQADGSGNAVQTV